MTEKVDLNHWRFKDKLKDIVNRNVQTIPYEGDEVDKDGIVDDTILLLSSKEYSLLHYKKPERK